jgi:predicted DNA-binding mobile mystery protein A
MDKQFRDLQLQQMDALLGIWKSAQLCPRPKSGWVRAVRETLGMSAAAFARRLGISHAGVRQLEASEASEVITLATLRKLAQALDCELHYALVPQNKIFSTDSRSSSCRCERTIATDRAFHGA